MTDERTNLRERRWRRVLLVSEAVYDQLKGVTDVVSGYSAAMW